MSKQMSDHIMSAQTGSPHRPTSLELDWADRQVADARARVARFAKLVDDDIGTGSLTTYSRRLLKTFEQILREQVTRRDALFVEFMKGEPKTKLARNRHLDPD